jgi:hypothetical protein
MFIIAAFVLGFFTMLLWNWLVPSLFHGPELDYLHAVGLLVLCRLLVGIRGPHRHWWHWKKWGRNGWGGYRRWGKPHGWNDSDCYEGNRGGANWADVALRGMDFAEYHDKWAKMTDEEKRQAADSWCEAKANLKETMRRQWGHKWGKMSPEEKRQAKESFRATKEQWKSDFKKGFGGQGNAGQPNPGEEIH